MSIERARTLLAAASREYGQQKDENALYRVIDSLSEILEYLEVELPKLVKFEAMNCQERLY